MNTIKIKGAIFDFDGTIAETIPLTLQAIRAAYADNSLPVPTEETIVSNFGANEYGMFYKMSPDCADKLFESYLSEYAALHEKYSPKPFEGIVDVLHKIKNSGALLTTAGGRPIFLSTRWGRVLNFVTVVRFYKDVNHDIRGL